MNKIKLELTEQEAGALCEILENNYGVCKSAEHLDRIKGKFYSAAYSIYENYSENSLSNSYCKENLFDKNSLFLVSGHHSLIMKNMMHKRLAYAVNCLGGMQQNGGQGTEFDHISQIKDEQAIKEALIDIIAAFGYKPSDLSKDSPFEIIG